jgi:hypothetical protein
MGRQTGWRQDAIKTPGYHTGRTKHQQVLTTVQYLGDSIAKIVNLKYDIITNKFQL